MISSRTAENNTFNMGANMAVLRKIDGVETFHISSPISRVSRAIGVRNRADNGVLVRR
jgi:hypothetical protein